MTPDKRLNQIEPVMADVLQKTDRLIEGQGQIIEIATRADQNANTAAKGVANLTVTTQKRLDQIDNRFDQVDSRFDQLDANQNVTRQDVGEMRQDIADLKAGQELILQILRDKLP